MSMNGYFAAIDKEVLHDLYKEPGLIEGYLHPHEGHGRPLNSIDVDKAWHGIHFMLSGQTRGGDDPLGMAVLGGQELGDDLDYGPARFLRPEQVQQVAAALVPIDEAAFRQRFDAEAMTSANIYPDFVWLQDGGEILVYLLENYLLLRRFYLDAAQRGDAVVLWLG